MMKHAYDLVNYKITYLFHSLNTNTGEADMVEDENVMLYNL